MVVGGKPKHPRQKSTNPKHFQAQQNKQQNSSKSKTGSQSQNSTPKSTSSKPAQTLAQFQTESNSLDERNQNPFLHIPKHIIKDPVTGFIELDNLTVPIEVEDVNKLENLESGTCEKFKFFEPNVFKDNFEASLRDYWGVLKKNTNTAVLQNLVISEKPN